MSDDPESSAKTIILLFEVPPPRSGHVVDLLREVAGIHAAYAVYSFTDVVAIFRGTETEYEAARKVIKEWHAPIKEIFEFRADDELAGPRDGTLVQYLSTACHAFVLCDVAKSAYEVAYAANVLKGLHEVRKLYINYERPEDQILLDVATESIASLDAAIMENVQKKFSVVKSTRTLIAINSLSWQRANGIEDKPSIFVGLAKEDLSVATEIENQLGRDTGLDIWDYRQIAGGNPNWLITIEEAMDRAPLHILVISPPFVVSPNCQKEYWRSLGGTRNPLDTLCVLVPGYTPTELPHQMQPRQVVSCSDMLWYSKVLSWVHERLKVQRGLEPVL